MINLINSIAVLVLISSISFSQEKIKLPKELKTEFVFIPMGKAFLEKDSSSVMAFYISKYEVSNKEYREFLNNIINTDNYKLALYDSVKWVDNLSYLVPMKDLYHSHPAYNNYPVVNITHEAAELYCKWLTEKYQKIIGNDYIINFRLPYKWEYIRASIGDNKFAVYPWLSPYLRNSKGLIMCNFKNIGDENIHYNPITKNYEIIKDKNNPFQIIDDATITAPVNSYYPNNYGVYNMSGNVSEMVSEKGHAYGGNWNSTGYDVRIDSKIEFNQASRYVGFRPVFSIVKK